MSRGLQPLARTLDPALAHAAERLPAMQPKGPPAAD